MNTGFVQLTSSVPPRGGDGADGAGDRAAFVPELEKFKGGDGLSTMNQDGSRRWLKPRLSPGRFLTRRRAVAYGLIALFTLLPYVEVNGKPLVLLDLTTRHFTIFGHTFLPTDTLLLALLLVGAGLSVFLVTAVLGRVWCGWACPQTVYMEFLYRPLERFFDGAPGRAKRWKWQGTPGARVAKYGAFLVASCFLAHTFLAYFVGVDALREWVTRSPLEHPTPFLVMATVTGLMMFDFAFFREQTCLVACPYGRFQSVMLDKQSLIVSYDPVRGEPRGRRGRGDDAKLGDCVDCRMCVTTCPTGIDIRNGLQMECVNCAQCIDACDAVMVKLGMPTGLVRYTSQSTLSGQRWKFLRPRVIVYPALIAVIATIFAVVLVNKLNHGSADLAVLRGRGLPYMVLTDGSVANQVRVKLTNRGDAPATYTFEVVDLPGAAVRAEENPVTLGPWETRAVPAQIVVPAGVIVGGTHDVRVRVRDGEKFDQTARYRVVGPTRAGPAGSGPAGSGSASTGTTPGATRTPEGGAP